ncbi:MAG: prepilin-type N-terminal cleavage/methylation domain-containing protein [candidate division WOR-3 bacterium]
MKRPDERGVTLIELLVVLMLLSLILTAAIKTWDVTLQRGRFEQTRQKLDRLAKVITGDPNYVVDGVRADFGFVGDMGALPRTLADLVETPSWVSPPESSLWRGPYVKPTFAESPEGYRIDAWGDTIIFDKDSMFLRSYGGGGLVDRSRWLTRPLGYTENDLLHNNVQGIINDQRGNPPPQNDSFYIRNAIKVELDYPRQGVRYVDAYMLRKEDNGNFSFLDVPQGVHTLRVILMRIYPPGQPWDTVTKMVTVFPKVGAPGLEIRMNCLWE